MYIVPMRVIAKSRLCQYAEKNRYREAGQQLLAWYDEMHKGTWKNFNELRRDYPTASLVGNNRVVFNIRGNAFRLIVKIEFRINAVYIRFFGTHKEYDTINAEEV